MACERGTPALSHCVVQVIPCPNGWQFVTVGGGGDTAARAADARSSLSWMSLAAAPRALASAMCWFIGYARTSTTEQIAGLEAQERDLKAVGVERLFKEQTSSVGERTELEAAIDFAREGDALVVTKLDRLARSVGHLAELVARLEAKKVSLRIVGMGVDTATPTGRLMLNLLGSIAQFEREVMLERQREGIAKAKSEGKYRGRAPTARQKAPQILEMDAQGNIAKEEIAIELGSGLIDQSQKMTAAAMQIAEK